ncbi:MAG: hypothetical protein C0625_04280 [Arcobacter sp.]|nr:MAG: hypothetical protein C0625_04280 [Arcobacter sp.]
MKCKRKQKKASSLFELILVIFVSSIVLIYTFVFTKELYETQINNEKIASLKIDLNSTKIIIGKNLPDSKNKLNYDGNTLFYGANILLKNVTSFTMQNSSNILDINITLENKISQTWKFKL